jgi:hypothetical protein
MSTTPVLTPPQQYTAGQVTANFKLPLDGLTTAAANALVAYDAEIVNAQANAEAASDPRGSAAAVLPGVTVSNTPPVAGQVLEASSPTAAAWTTPSGGSGNTKTVRSAPTSFTEGGVTGPIPLTFATPFADNNYTVQVTVLGDEVAPETPTLTQSPAVGISYIAFQAVLGAGVNVWITNNDSGAHTGIIHVTAIHD